MTNSIPTGRRFQLLKEGVQPFNEAPQLSKEEDPYGFGQRMEDEYAEQCQEQVRIDLNGNGKVDESDPVMTIYYGADDGDAPTNFDDVSSAVNSAAKGQPAEGISEDDVMGEMADMGYWRMPIRSTSWENGLKINSPSEATYSLTEDGKIFWELHPA